MTEREEAIVSYMAQQVGKSIELLDKKSDGMIKVVTTLLTGFTALASYLNISFTAVITPIIFLCFGLIFFIVASEPMEITYVIGGVNSSIKAYEQIVKHKKKLTNIGYLATYSGLIIFIIAILTKNPNC